MTFKERIPGGPLGGRLDLRRSTDLLIESLRDSPNEKVVTEAMGCLEALRDGREYERLGMLAEEIGRVDPSNRAARKYYAQSLIDTGKATLALDVLKNALRGVKRGKGEYDELKGLVGRANKQIFIDAGVRSASQARAALSNAVKAYREPFERVGNYWHGINLAAVLHAARKQEVRVAPSLDERDVVSQVLDALEHVREKDRNAWWHATKAEAHAAREEWEEAEESIHRYITDEGVKPFHLASTLRQLRDVWELQRDSDEVDNARAQATAGAKQ